MTGRDLRSLAQALRNRLAPLGQDTALSHADMIAAALGDIIPFFDVDGFTRAVLTPERLPRRLRGGTK